MSAGENVVSRTETVVSQKVINKGNPILNFLGLGWLGEKFSNLGASIKAIPFGILLLIGGFVLIYSSVFSVKEYSKIVATLEQKDAAQVTGNEGNLLIKGTVKLNQPFMLTYQKCSVYGCTAGSGTDLNLDNIIYYSASFERYEQKLEKKNETRKKVVNGQEVEETVEIKEVVEAWEEKSSSENWADFSIGNIKVNNPDKAMNLLTSSSQTIENVFIAGLGGDPVTVPEGVATATSELGKTRLVVDTIANDKTILAAANVKGNAIGEGDLFILSESENKDALVADLIESETTSKTILRVLSWICLTFGIMTVLGPILSLLDFIPFAGKIANTIAFFVGAIISSIIVLAGVIFLQYWWLFLILFVLLIIGGIWAISKARSKATK